MTLKQLKELIVFKGGGTPSKKKPTYWEKGEISWATVKDFKSTALKTTQDSITQQGLENSASNLIPKGHVIIPTRMALGKAAINTIDLAINQDLRALIPKVPLDTKYLLYAMLSLEEEILKKGSGATVKGITQENLYNLRIPIPEGSPEESLDAQKRIAHLLSQVEALIAQRKQSLQDLDTLLKSVFLDMFGDPVRNEKGWDTETSDVYSTTVNVGVVIKPASYYVNDGVVALRSLNIRPNKIDLTKVVYFSESANTGKLSKSILRENDVLIVRTGNAGTAAVVTDKLDGANCIDLIQVRPNPKILNSNYFSHLLNSERGSQLTTAKQVGGIHKHFNVGALRKLKLPIPPIQLQLKFSDFTKKTDQIEKHYQANLTKLEALYSAISQKAFKGELDLSNISLPEELTAVHELQADYSQPQTKPESTKPKPFELTEDSLFKLIGSQAKELDIPTLMSELQDQLTAHLSEDDEEQEAPSVSYEEVSQHLINLLEKKKLTQSYNETENQVLVSLTSA